MAKNKYSNQPTMLEVIFVGFFKAIYWLVKLPFSRFKTKAFLSPEERVVIMRKKREIENLSFSENIIELRHAVIEADKLVDKIFKMKGYKGDTFAERLRVAEGDIDSKIYQNIWSGHKIRNQIAHEEGQISSKDLKQAVSKLLNYVGSIWKRN